MGDGLGPPLGVALLGYGYAGRTFHAPLVAATPGLRLAAVGSSDPAKVRADLPDAPVLPVAEAARAPGVDAVVVATPNDTHAALARAALLAGRHVVVDKPFTLSAAEARDLAALARRAGLVLAAFHNRRWDADFLALRGLVAGGALGRLATLESRFDRWRPGVRRRWREAAGPGGGLWWDLGPHLVDQALLLMGPPEGVRADLAVQRDGGEAVDHAHVVLRYPGGVRAVLHASMLAAAETPRFAAHGTLGSYVKHGLDPQEDALKRGEAPGSPGWGEDPRPGTLTAWEDGAPVARPAPGPPGDYPAFYAAFRDAALGRGPNPVPAEEAAAVVAVLELAVRSAEEGGRELAFGEADPR
jgi:predicted dehydrogenase